MLRGESAHHLTRVLRAQPGQLYELSDGEAVWLARAERVGRDAVEFALVEALPARAPRLHLTLLLAIVKFDRFEWCLEKATELGASEIVPLAAARSDKALVAAAAKRAGRWQKILLESAQQARRLRPLVLSPITRADKAFSVVEAQRVMPRSPGHNADRAPQAVPILKLILSERPGAPGAREVLEEKAASPKGKGTTCAALAIGPEGGWTDGELVAACDAGFAEVSLGSNILRTETAVIAALAVLNYALGD